MVGSVDAMHVEPVMNPSLRESERLRIFRMTIAETVGRTGPVRQTRYREQIVSPVALEQQCGTLLQRAQRAISTIVTSRIYADDLRGILPEPSLQQHEWQIAVTLREITELMLDLVSSHTAGTTGPMTNAVLIPQKRAILIARDAAKARVVAFELLAAQVAAAEAARRDWEMPTGWRPTTTSTLT